MLNRQPVAVVRPSPRSRRRANSGGGGLVGKESGPGEFTMASQPLFLADLCNDSTINGEHDQKRLNNYRRQIKLVPIRREVLYYETAQGNIIPMDRRHRKMRRSRSMRDGEFVGGQPKANCLGLLELRASRRQARPHSVDASERLQVVPVLTTSTSIEMSEPPDATKPDRENSGDNEIDGASNSDVQSRVKSVPAVFVPVDVSGELFDRYCQMRRSQHGVEYQPVVVRRQRRHPAQRHQARASTATSREQRSHSYDALEPQLAALHDPSRSTVLLPGHRCRHSMAPRPVDYEEARRLATVKRSSSMPATPPSIYEFNSWRSSSDLTSSRAASGQSGPGKLRRSFSQRARDFFRRSRSTENALAARGRSKSPFSWLFRGANSRDRLAGGSGGDNTTLTSSSCGGSGSLLSQEPVVLRHPDRKSRDRAKKAPRDTSNGGNIAATSVVRAVTSPAPPVLASARPPTAVDCPDYMETLRALSRVLSRRHKLLPEAMSAGGVAPLQGIPVQKAKVWLRTGRDVIKKRRAPDRYSADAMPIAVSVTAIDPLSTALAPHGSRVKSASASFFASGGAAAAGERKRCSAQEAGQRAKAAFAGQCVGKVSLSHSTSEHLDKLSQQFSKAVTLRRSYRTKRPEDRRSSSGNWSATSSSTTRPSRASSAGAHPNLPRSVSRDSALGMHSSSIERSDSLFPTGVVSSSTSQLASSLSSLSTQQGGTPCFDAPTRLHYLLSHTETDVEPIHAHPKKQLSSVKESPAHVPRYRSFSCEDSDDVFDTTIVHDASSTETLSEENHFVASPVVKRRHPPAPPPRIDSLRNVKRGVIATAPRKIIWSDGRSPPIEIQQSQQSSVCPKDFEDARNRQSGVICESWYRELLPYKSNTLPRNLSTRLRKRDSLPSGGGIADMSSSWPCATPDSETDTDSGEDPPLPPPPTSLPPKTSSLVSSSASVEATTPSAPSCGKSLNFAPHASLNVYDQSVPTNACSAAVTHRILKPQALPASGSCSSPPAETPKPNSEEDELRPGSPSLKQYQHLYSLNRGLEANLSDENNGAKDEESEYEEEATMV